MMRNDAFKKRSFRPNPASPLSAFLCCYKIHNVIRTKHRRLKFAHGSDRRHAAAIAGGGGDDAADHAQGGKRDFGLGWFRSHEARQRRPAFVEHLGGGAGFWSVMLIYPEE